jgi:hypothetical protein
VSCDKNRKKERGKKIIGPANEKDRRREGGQTQWELSTVQPRNVGVYDSNEDGAEYVLKISNNDGRKEYVNENYEYHRKEDLDCALDRKNIERIFDDDSKRLKDVYEKQKKSDGKTPKHDFKAGPKGSYTGPVFVPGADKNSFPPRDLLISKDQDVTDDCSNTPFFKDSKDGASSNLTHERKVFDAEKRLFDKDPMNMKDAGYSSAGLNSDDNEYSIVSDPNPWEVDPLAETVAPHNSKNTGNRRSVEISENRFLGPEDQKFAEKDLFIETNPGNNTNTMPGKSGPIST